MKISRRHFLGSTALGSLTARSLMAATSAKTAIPTRLLGRTGAHVSILAMGAGSRFLMYKEEDKAIEAVQRAVSYTHLTLPTICSV